MNTNQKRHSHVSLRPGVLYAYGLGEFGFSFFLVYISYYLMYFLTDVICFPVETAAVVYTLVQWFECLTLLGAGFLMDRFRIGRGVYRPWVLWGSIVCAVGMVLFFTRWPLSQGVYLIVFPLCYLLAYAGYNFLWVAYRALMAKLGRHQQDTVALTTAAGQLGTLAMLLFSLFGTRLLYGFSTVERGYSVSAVVYGTVIVVCGIVVFRVTKHVDVELLPVGSRKTPRLKDTLKSLSGQMIPFFLAFTLRGIVQQLIPALMVYHFTYSVGNPQAVQYYMLVYMAAQLLALAVIQPVTNALGKKNTYPISAVSTAVLLVTAYFFSRDLTVFLALMGLNAFVTTFSASMLPAFITDIADYNEYMLGSKDRSFTMSVGAMVLTAASLLGSAAAAFGLAAIGYSGTLSQVPEAMARNITRLMLFGGAVCALLSAIPMCFYKLNEKTMDAVYARRRELETAANTTTQ